MFLVVRIAADRYSRRRLWTRLPTEAAWIERLGSRFLAFSRQAMRGACKKRFLTLPIHEALVKARVPSYPEAYESRYDHRLSELTEVKSNPAHLIDAGVQALRKNCAR